MKNRTRPEILIVVLLAISAMLLFAIVTGTIWAFASGRMGNAASDGKGRELASAAVREADRQAVLEANAGSANNLAIFSDIGLLRAGTADKKSCVVVISPLLTYRADDLAFREELVSKNRAIRLAVLDWFQTRTLKEITKMGEPAVKEALLERINAQLVLGSIHTIYFGEYMVLD